MCLVCLGGCRQETKNKELLQRSFYNTVWERFDYVRNDIEFDAASTLDLTAQVSFTDDYPYEDFSMVFTVFTADEEPYRSKAYTFKLKDEDGNWKSELKDGAYTFDFPINKGLQIVDPGVYRFQLEYRMPITPIVGVKEIKLINNWETIKYYAKYEQNP